MGNHRSALVAKQMADRSSIAKLCIGAESHRPVRTLADLNTVSAPYRQYAGESIDEAFDL